ncbi:Hypothetical predicted protein [Podarcis lilfordi]|uniref:Uncharacterized protein n=1 Tax=Podarcis lilfordi TaxID=74358 RepID=A0AA35NVZ4_9SAUR|nr:Hypothetical predicted protein [Podarcis lilfordi]
MLCKPAAPSLETSARLLRPARKPAKQEKKGRGVARRASRFLSPPTPFPSFFPPLPLPFGNDGGEDRLLWPGVAILQEQTEREKKKEVLTAGSGSSRKFLGMDP